MRRLGFRSPRRAITPLGRAAYALFRRLTALGARFVAAPQGTRKPAARWPQAPRKATLRPPQGRRRTRTRKGFDIDQPGQPRPAGVRLALIGELVDVARSVRAAMDEHVLELDQPLEVHPRLRRTEARRLPRLPAAKAKILPRDRLPLARRPDMPVEQCQHPPRLGRQLVERAAQHLVREAVRHRDVVQRGLDVLHQLPLVLHRLHRPLATPRPPRLHAAQAPSAAPRRPSSASPGYRAVSRTRSSRWSRPSSISTRDGRVERTELQGRRSTLAKMDPKESSKESAASNSGRNLQPFDQQANAHKNSNQS
jgi:hypothetical protein